MWTEGVVVMLLLVIVWNSGPNCGSDPVPKATARMATGAWRRSAARSVLVMTTAHAASVSSEQSNSRSGSLTIGASRYWERLSGLLCIMAFGLALARARIVTAID